MPGMNSGPDPGDPGGGRGVPRGTDPPGTIALLIFGLISAVWAVARARLTSSSGKAGRAAAHAEAWASEPAGRRLPRLGFGLLWIFDGMLKAQPAMAVGLPAKVIAPTATSSPRWVQHVVNRGSTTWWNHPDPGRSGGLDPGGAGRPV